MQKNELRLFGEMPLSRRFFFGFGKRKKSEARQGAMEASAVEAEIRKYGVSKKVRVSMVDYSGTVIEEIPIIITAITKDHFTGKFVNVDRDIREKSDSTSVYVKGGGGTIDFYFADGDIAAISDDIDNEIADTMDNSEIIEILAALEVGDEVLVSCYDRSSGGVINGMGNLSGKNLKAHSFSVAMHKVNEIDQKTPVVRTFSLETDKIIALQII